MFWLTIINQNGLSAGPLQALSAHLPADNSAQAQPTPVAAQPMTPDVVPHYKGGNNCKTKAVKKHHHKHVAKKVTTTETTSTDATAADASTSAQ